MTGKTTTAKRKRRAPRKAPALGAEARMQKFVLEYIVDFNGRRAAIAAGYAAKSAESKASQLLRNVKVQALLAAETEARNERLKMNADDVLRDLVRERTADIAAIFDDAGGLKPISEWPMVFRTGLVTGIEVNELFGLDDEGNRTQVGYTKKIKLVDRTKHLEMIGRHVRVGAFKEKIEHTVAKPLEELAKQISGNRLQPKEQS